MCWVTDGKVSYAQYWVASSGDSKLLCTIRYPDVTLPAEVAPNFCV